jgi:transcriptional regulator with XRE-family HTH domain
MTTNVVIERGVEVDTEKLQKLRKMRLLTLRALSEKSGVSPNTIWRLEHGHNAHPATIVKLAEVLGVEPTELVRFD